MLVLSRKVGQSLVIGSDIRLKVVEIRGQQVRLGVEAPDEVSIVRLEILEAVARENRDSARGGEVDIGRLASSLKRPRKPPSKDSAEKAEGS